MKYRRARIRHLLFTAGPNRITRGRMVARHQRSDVVVRNIDAWSPNWPQAFDGLRIAHVSDFHLGDLLPLEQAINIVAQINELDADLVVCTGDVVDLDHTQAGPLLDALGAVDAPMGCSLVLGNHDELHCGDTVRRLACKAGITVLGNDVQAILHDQHQLLIGGIDWARDTATCARYVDDAGGSDIHILLAHNPKAFHRAAVLGIPLTLSGHTHGGQIALPRRPRANLAITHRFNRGLYTIDHSNLYVTAGVGAWFPLRWNCDPEIALITMTTTAPDCDADG